MDLKKEVKIMQTNTIFSVFVENLSELNEGNMVGCWVDFPCDYDEWKKVLAKIGNPEEMLSEAHSSAARYRVYKEEYDKLQFIEYMKAVFIFQGLGNIPNNPLLEDLTELYNMIYAPYDK